MSKLRGNLSFGLYLTLLCASFASALTAQALRIEILRGDRANNDASTGAGVSPVVRVVDPNNNPVAGALVVFSSAEDGARVEFAGFGPVATVLTDDRGLAGLAGLRAAGENGPVEIHVLANLHNAVANATIRQMNVGIGAAAAKAQELSAVLLQPYTAASDHKKNTIVTVRIEDGNGRPIQQAAVRMSLFKLGRGGRQELATTHAVSDAQGEATGSLRREAGARFELVVRAEAGGRCVTRYFTAP